VRSTKDKHPEGATNLVTVPPHGSGMWRSCADLRSRGRVRLTEERDHDRKLRARVFRELGLVPTSAKRIPLLSQAGHNAEQVMWSMGVEIENYIGLYYPYIHFRDEGWLKSTLLYWDRIQRIVPEQDPAEPGDSETVRRLASVGFVQDVSPMDEMRTIGDTFLRLIKRHGDELVERYGIAAPSRPGTKPWVNEAEPWASTRPQSNTDPRLTHVYYGKLDERLVSALVEAGMATPPAYDETLGMHPELAAVYLTGLAELVAQKTISHPLTQEPMAHVAAAGMTLERLTATLLLEKETALAEQTDQEIRQEMASLAFPRSGSRRRRWSSGGPAHPLLEEAGRGSSGVPREDRAAQPGTAGHPLGGSRS
jgi:hypothetical protein